MGELEQLERWLAEEKAALVTKAVSLIHDDAPKNRFSMLAGDLRRIEEVEMKIGLIKREREP